MKQNLLCINSANYSNIFQTLQNTGSSYLFFRARDKFSMQLSSSFFWLFQSLLCAPANHVIWLLSSRKLPFHQSVSKWAEYMVGRVFPVPLMAAHWTQIKLISSSHIPLCVYNSYTTNLSFFHIEDDLLLIRLCASLQFIGHGIIDFFFRETNWN